MEYGTKSLEVLGMTSHVRRVWNAIVFGRPYMKCAGASIVVHSLYKILCHRFEITLKLTTFSEASNKLNRQVDIHYFNLWLCDILINKTYLYAPFILSKLSEDHGLKCH